MVISQCCWQWPWITLLPSRSVSMRLPLSPYVYAAVSRDLSQARARQCVCVRRLWGRRWRFQRLFQAGDRNFDLVRCIAECCACEVYVQCGLLPPREAAFRMFLTFRRSIPRTSGRTPPPRQQHVMCGVRDTIVIAGALKSKSRARS